MSDHAEFNYEMIKDLAKRAGLPVKAALALSEQNDPFYVGKPADIKKAEWFANIWNRASFDLGGAHLRKVHYWTLSHSSEQFTVRPLDNPLKDPRYQNTEECWQYLVSASKYARYLGLVGIDRIQDNKNPLPIVNSWRASVDHVYHEIPVPDITKPDIKLYGAGNANAQPYHLEVWCEKSTMNSVLMPVCNGYLANLVTFEGEVSITACYQFLQRVREANWKPARLFYVSDFDPAGNSMPVATARKIEFLISHYNYPADVQVLPIALTLEQVESYHLPRIPIKETELRAKTFEDSFGEGAVELDALEALYPHALEHIVEEELDLYYDKDAERHARRVASRLKADVQARIDAILREHPQEVEAATRLMDRFTALQTEFEFSEYQVEQFPPEVDEPEDLALFDTRREYLDQILYYKRHKGKE